ncbi:HSP20 family protein [Nitrobacteraceae bacterium AZCC 1564]
MKSLFPVHREVSPVRRIVSPFMALQQEIDNLFDGFTRGFGQAQFQSLVPNMDVSETAKEIEVTAELPGLEEKDIQLSVTDQLLSIRGEKKSEREEKDKDYHVLERTYGSFSRTVELPPGINPDSIKAVMSKGVLKVTIPKPAPSQSKKIDVKTA